MAYTGNILSARLEVKDSFSSQLDKFVNKLTASENAFNKFANAINKNSSKFEIALDKINRKMDQTVNKIVSKTNNVANAVEKSTNRIEQSQNKSINNLTTRYNKMGNDVQGVFKNINKDAEGLTKSGLKINIGSSSSTRKSTTEENNGNSILGGIFAGKQTEGFLGGMLGGNITRILGNLSLIGAGITGMKKVLDTLDNWAQQGFNALNSITTDLFSANGLKEGLQSAGKFETNRVAMNVLYGNDKIGQNYYQIGTKLAKETPYSETGVGELQKKLAGAKIKYNEKDLMTVLDLASVKPELGAEHVGFSLVDAMYGRTTSLKTNYMIDNKEVQKYLKNLPKSKDSTDRMNAKKWKDAFVSTGSVGNKQEYFDLLVDFVRKETKFSGLTDKYSKTINGLIDRMEGNWETIRADLLGLDANNTGMAKEGKITVFSSIKEAIDNFDIWLSDDKTKNMLLDLGEGLGKGVHAITDVFSDLLKKINWDKVGKTFEKIGESIARIIDKLTSNPEFEKMLDNLPNLVEKTLNNKVIETTRDTKTGVDLASGNYFQAIKDWTKGTSDKYNNLLGKNGDTLDINGGKMVNPYASIETPSSFDYLTSLNDNMLTDANADTYLSQNPNLNEDQRNQIKDRISNDNQTIYNVTIHEIKADNFEDIVNSINSVQNNKK